MNKSTKCTLKCTGTINKARLCGNAWSIPSKGWKAKPEIYMVKKLVHPLSGY